MKRIILLLLFFLTSVVFCQEDYYYYKKKPSSGTVALSTLITDGLTHNWDMSKNVVADGSWVSYVVNDVAPSTTAQRLTNWWDVHTVSYNSSDNSVTVCSGNNRYFLTMNAAAITTADFTIFIVMKTPLTTGALLGQGNQGSGDLFGRLYAGSNQLGTSQANYWATLNGTVQDNTKFLITVEQSSTAGRTLHFNNTGTTNSNASITSIPSNTEFVLGGKDAGGYGKTSTFYHILIYNRTLSSSEIAQMKRYLNNKWSIY